MNSKIQLEIRIIVYQLIYWLIYVSDNEQKNLYREMPLGSCLGSDSVGFPSTNLLAMRGFVADSLAIMFLKCTRNLSVKSSCAKSRCCRSVEDVDLRSGSMRRQQCKKSMVTESQVGNNIRIEVTPGFGGGFINSSTLA